MEIKKFVELVAQMRAAQKAYFRTRNYNDLDNSKLLERQVDNALRSISENDNQLSLFSSAASS